jgi:hypothetical protein
VVRKDSLVSSKGGGEDGEQDGNPTPEQEGCAGESESKNKESGPLVEIEMLLSRTGHPGGGTMEGRLRQGGLVDLILRRREHLEVKMSAWRPRDYCAWALLRLALQGFEFAGAQFAACSVPLIRHVLTGHSLRHRISDTAESYRKKLFVLRMLCLQQT